MTRLFTRFALAAAAAGLTIAPGWAQTPVPTSPNDPLARIHGWVESAPASQQSAKPDAEAPAAKPAAGSEAAKVPPEPPAQKPASGSQTATVAPPAKPAPEAKPAPGPTAVPEQGEAAPPSPAPHPAHPAKHARAAERPREHREEADRRPKPGDRSADQLNRQELNKLTTARGSAATARP